MIAYFVYNSESDSDTIVLPEMACTVPVDRQRFEAFIAPKLAFADWSGESCADRKPEDHGTVVATRDDEGDVCVLDKDLWRKRMDYHLTLPR